VDHWDAYVRWREHSHDPVREWADLEGKSPSMSEDLYQAQMGEEETRSRVFAPLMLTAKLLTAVVKMLTMSNHR
jgi:hypothetical protein